MAETRDLLLRFLGDSRSLDKSSKDAGRDLKGVEKQTSRTSKAFGGLNKAVIGIGVAIGGAAIAQWANDAGKMADSANLAAQSLDKALGPAADDFRDSMEKNRKTLGLNTLEVDQLGAKLGLLVTGMGVGQEATALYSQKLVDIGGDLAAFKGDLSDAEGAVDAVTAAIRGEFDPLEQYGVKLSEAGISAEIAKREGLDPLFAALSEGEKRMVVITDTIEQNAAPAMGALGDATDSVAGKQNELSTEMEDLQIVFGDSVNQIKGPLMQALVIGIRGFVTFFEAIGTAIGEFLVENIETIRALQRGWASFAAFMMGLSRGINATVRTMLGPIRSVSRSINDLIRKASSVARTVSSTLGKIRIPGFASGGMVGGPRGAPQLAVVHGGERVTTANGVQRGDGGGGSGMTVNVTVHAGIGNPQETARAIVDVLQIYNRTNGAIPISTVNNGIPAV